MSDAGWAQDAGWVLPGGGVSAADVSASGPFGATNVQDALDISRRTFGGNFGIIDNIDDLDLYMPPDGMTGERTIAGQFWLSNKITMRAGEWCTYGVDGILAGPSSAACGLIADVNGPVISGGIVASNICFENVNAGGSARIFDITGAGSRILRIEYCACVGAAPVGTISNVSNLLTIDRLIVIGAASGFVLSGTLEGLGFLDCAFSGLPSGHVAISVGATAAVVEALSFIGNTFITADPTDRAIRIDESATLPGVPVTDPVTPSAVVGVSITGSVFIGPGQLYDQGPGTLPLDSPRIVTEGNPNVINSRVLGDVDFKDYVTPILVTYVGPAFQVVPSENAGAASVLTLLDTSARFSLFRDPADPTSWYIQADGPSDQNVSLSWEASLEANAGGGAGEFLEFQVDKVDRTVTFDLGAAAAAPIGTYTLTLDGDDFDVVLGAPSTRDAVVTAMIALVDADSQFAAVNGADAEQIEVTAESVIQASTAAPGAEAWVESRVWSLVVGSESRMEQRVQSQNNTHLSYDVAKVADRYRLSMRNIDGTSTTKLQHYNLIAAKA